MNHVGRKAMMDSHNIDFQKMKVGASHSSLFGLQFIQIVLVEAFSCMPLKWAKAKRITFLGCFFIPNLTSLSVFFLM